MPLYPSVPTSLNRKVCDSARVNAERKLHGFQSTSVIQGRGFAFNATQHDVIEMNDLIELNSNIKTPT